MAEDPRVIAQRGVNPLTGSYLSKRERLAMFRSANVSSSAFGGGRGGRGLVRSSAAIVPQTTAIVKRNEQDIGTLADSIRVIAAKVQDLGSTVSTVANSVSQNQLLEAEKARQENKQEEQLANEELRTGREDALEKKLQTALFKPVQKIAAKAQNLFGRIRTAMLFLLGGWLTNSLLSLFDARRRGLKDKFEEIKKNLQRSLLQIGAVLLAATLGFNLLTRILGRLAFKIAGLSAKILLLPFRVLGRLGLNLLRKVPGFSRAAVTGTQNARLLNRGRNMVGGGAKVTTSGGKVVQGSTRAAATTAATRTGSRIGARRLALGSLPLIGALVDGFAAVNEAARGNFTGASLFLASAGASFLPGKGTLASIPLTAAAIAQSATFKAEGDSNPNIESLAEGAADGKTTLEPNNIQSSNNSSSKMSLLGPLPDLTPEAVLIPQEQASVAPSGGISGSAFNVPVIASSNIDNFYTMYSKMVYNVVD